MFNTMCIIGGSALIAGKPVPLQVKTDISQYQTDISQYQTDTLHGCRPCEVRWWAYAAGLHSGDRPGAERYRRRTVSHQSINSSVDLYIEPRIYK